MAVTSKEVEWGGTHWRLLTSRGIVHVFDIGGPGVTVYVHGFQDTVDSALTRFRLLEQFATSGKGGTFIIPEAPSSAEQAVQFTSLDGLLAAVQAETGLALNGQVTAIGHSGAYRTLLHWLTSPRLTHLVLLDALYAGTPQFVAWGIRPGHTLDIVVTPTGAPRKNAEAAGIPHVLSSLSHFALVTPPTSLLPDILRKSATAGGVGAIVAVGMVALLIWLLK